MRPKCNGWEAGAKMPYDGSFSSPFEWFNALSLSKYYSTKYCRLHSCATSYSSPFEYTFIKAFCETSVDFFDRAPRLSSFPLLAG